MLNGGLNHIWMVPIDVWVAALQQLYIAQDEIKNSIYEIMGISDIMRGATKATETTAQRIKGSMGVSRLSMKGVASNFVRDMLRLKAEIICKNFDTATLAKMTGEQITEVEAIIRSDFMRTCRRHRGRQHHHRRRAGRAGRHGDIVRDRHRRDRRAACCRAASCRRRWSWILAGVM
jgi:hypothetical protein